MLCEEHFKKYTAQDDTGRYTVRLPRREGQGRLGESYEQARRRFHQLERRFQEHPDLHQAYSEFMQEYEGLGHMKQITEMQAAQRKSITFPITWISRVPAIQQALALFFMAHVVRVTDSL
jgi:hypothetical protein